MVGCRGAGTIVRRCGHGGPREGGPNRLRPVAPSAAQPWGRGRYWWARRPVGAAGRIGPISVDRANSPSSPLRLGLSASCWRWMSATCAQSCAPRVTRVLRRDGLGLRRVAGDAPVPDPLLGRQAGVHGKASRPTRCGPYDRKGSSSCSATAVFASTITNVSSLASSS